MKFKWIRILCTALCAILLCGVSVYALSSDEGTPAPTATGATESVTLPAADGAATGKDETVYVLCASDGSVKKTIVSDWLANGKGVKNLSDVTTLSEIVNVKGTETVTVDSDGKAVWNTEGGDIYYQGTTDAEAPVGISVTYLLDGKTIAPADLAGKSGKVTIRYRYENRESVKVGDTTYYIPFLAVTGMLLDNSVFTNIAVKNGKLINDGTRSIVIGYALPGLGADLGVASTFVQIPETVEITADVENFSMAMTLSIVTNELFNLLPVDQINDILGRAAKAEQFDLPTLLSIINGGTPYTGNGGVALINRINAVLDDLLATMQGIGTLLDDVKDLSDDLNALTAKNDALNGGAGQIFASLLAAADEQLQAAGVTGIPALTAENYETTLDGVIADLNDPADAETKEKISALKQSLADAEAFTESLKSYTDGVQSAANDAKTILTSYASLKVSAEELAAAIGKIAGLSPTAKDLATRLHITLSIAKTYVNFAGKDASTPGSVKFIYKIDGISTK